jgi:CheY-like chemotaxis protein/two-component sensor histidine kinase
VRLVDDLVEVARITRGKIELRKSRIVLADVLTQAVETAQPLVDAAGHELTVALPEAPVFLEGDPVRLTQVFSNLLNNAAKYTPSGGSIRMTAHVADAHAVVSVKDTGQGIPADMLARVFDLFMQVDRGTARAKSGLGIGLTLVKTLVEMHGGTVEARSEGAGAGSEFLVRLPLAGATDAGAARPAAPAASRSFSALRVLVVDDNRDAADSLGVLLGLLGAEVEVVHGGADALRALETSRPSLVLLDIGMPGMDGYEVARRIRAMPALAGVTIAALTGWGQPEDRRRTREAGFDVHLVKPPDLAALEALVASLSRE